MMPFFALNAMHMSLMAIGLMATKDTLPSPVRQKLEIMILWPISSASRVSLLKVLQQKRRMQ